QLTIVGDAFARPMLEALDDAERQGDPYDLSSLKVILSSGVMWSRESKEALHRWTAAILADSLGSSEGVGFAMSVSRPGAAAATASFTLGPNSAVFNEEGKRVVPGSGERGLLAVRGAIPLGYHNDVDKSAQTFRTFEGETWSVPGDFATVESDGTIRLLGRGSACINTAGEKVYPEEVEEVLKLHPLVADANVVGVPDEKWGAAVHAVVALTGDQQSGSEVEGSLRDHCRHNLAGYKCPKVIHFVSEVQRGPNGKPDYNWARGVVVSD
ncbi:MAG: AMP-binding protein, partial [Microthrixaceae bacterium]|nr:AMP-binding protein [Microthrixaceae bacterium]